MMSTRRKRFVAAMSLWLAVASSATADEAPVYESLADVEIGRIFLSPEQRSGLDARRGKVPPVPTAAATRNRNPAKSSSDAAGYILKRGGQSQVWSRGGFVPSDDVNSVRFPGDVKVRQSAERERDVDPGVADDDP